MLHTSLQKCGAHVDDSAAFQVYNNINENDVTTRAVRETEGMIVTKDGSPVTTYFYSTSCGYGTDLSAWNSSQEAYLKSRKIGTGEEQELTNEENFEKFIKGIDASCYESGESYFRWLYETELDEKLLLETLQKRYEANPEQILTQTEDGFTSREIKKLGKIKKIEVLARAEGGAVRELLITGEQAVVKVISEKNVRYVLANASEKLSLGSGYTKEGTCSGMLPSAFLWLQPEYGEGDAQQYITGYKIYGGGFGHGIGMSQNGAKNMAGAGMDFLQILQFFYQDTELTTLRDT
jgi:stage II sporulation protein D